MSSGFPIKTFGLSFRQVITPRLYRPHRLMGRDSPNLNGATMNMHASIPATPAARIPEEHKPGYAARMLELFIKINAIRHDFLSMPDEAMDKLTDAMFAVGRAIVDAPPIDEDALAAKFKYAALLIEDPDADLDEAPSLIDRLLTDLAGMRHAEWQAMTREGHPWHHGVAS
jgi:hypothetical protein